ncbi:MAG: hypothetical protein ACOY3Y_06975, partial [Acidobacteriota bacterium]
ITIEEMPLADGRRAIVHDGKVYLPNPAGALRLAPKRRYALKGGGELAVKAGGRLHRTVLEKGFDPQPEPPGISLHGELLGGEEVVLERRQLFLVKAGARSLSPDGSYRLTGGASLKVLGGRIVELSSLEGLTLNGANQAQR